MVSRNRKNRGFPSGARVRVKSAPKATGVSVTDVNGSESEAADSNVTGTAPCAQRNCNWPVESVSIRSAGWASATDVSRK